MASFNFPTGSACVPPAGRLVPYPLAGGRPRSHFIRTIGCKSPTTIRNSANPTKRPDDAVALAGLAMYPYTAYYHTDWRVILTADQLNELRSKNPRTLVVTTFPVYLEAALPDKFQSLQRDFKLLKRFDGTVEGGTVFVYASKP